MALSKIARDKIFLMEEVVNFPTSLLHHQTYQWKNLPMVPHSNLRGAVASLTEKGKKVAIITGFNIPGGDPPATETDGPPGVPLLQCNALTTLPLASFRPLFMDCPKFR